jgi:hypothetical protein
VYWLFDKWREIKRHDSDAGKNPVGHALSVLVPLYSLFRVYGHTRTIERLVRSSGGQTSLQPATALIAWMIACALLQVSNQPNLGWLLIVATALAGGMVAWAQAALNLAWRLQPEGVQPRPIHPREWVVMIVGGILTAASVFR